MTLDSPYITAALIVGLLCMMPRQWWATIGLPFTGLINVWRALSPNFSQFATWRATTQTFNMLISAMVVFGVMLIVWAAGAGVLRAVWVENGAPANVNAIIPPPAAVDLAWRIGFLAAEIARAVGGVLLIGCASGLVGSLLGFVFGIPRPVSAAESPPAGAGGVQPTAVNRPKANRAWELSTNLTQVSDWLTKIIVGVGLVEAKTGIGTFQALANAGALWLFNMRHGSPALIGAAIIGCAVFGFLFAYLYTQLIVARLIEAADRDLSLPDAAGELQAIKQMSPWSEALVPRISRSRFVPDTVIGPSAEQVRAALAISRISFTELTSRPDATSDMVLAWARAKAVLNQYKDAAEAYLYLFQMRP